jgi:hypothetical protein
MGPTQPSEIRPSAFEGTDRVDDKVPRDCRMEPQRLPLITVQSNVRAEASRQGLDLAPMKPSLCWASLDDSSPWLHRSTTCWRDEPSLSTSAGASAAWALSSLTR